MSAAEAIVRKGDRCWVVEDRTLEGVALCRRAGMPTTLPLPLTDWATAEQALAFVRGLPAFAGRLVEVER